MVVFCVGVDVAVCECGGAAVFRVCDCDGVVDGVGSYVVIVSSDVGVARVGVGCDVVGVDDDGVGGYCVDVVGVDGDGRDGVGVGVADMRCGVGGVAGVVCVRVGGVVVVFVVLVVVVLLVVCWCCHWWCVWCR